MARHHIAQVNIGKMKAQLDSPVMADLLRASMRSMRSRIVAMVSSGGFKRTKKTPPIYGLTTTI
jgi:hypothetical protein